MTEATAREAMEYDVVIVGAGPAGLAAAIRLKQLDENCTVVVVEKGSAVGAHSLSGVVIDTTGLDRLLRDWRHDPERPLTQEVTGDRFYVLTAKSQIPIPGIMLPPLMNNHGNFVGSLGALTRYLGTRAEALGVEIYPGFAATEVLYGDNDEVVGVATGDMGIDRNGEEKPGFTRGIDLRGKYTLIAEGARGSLAKQLIQKFRLDANSEPQKFAIGIKEIWQIAPEKFNAGHVQHSFGYPLTGTGATGGGFLYHYGDRMASVGFVVHLNYTNPTTSPFDEFQRYKNHPLIRGVLEGGKRIAYGARAISAGGWQSAPKLTFPGGALLGCSAGFVNFARVKGSHNAVFSGVQAAEAAHAALKAGSGEELSAYDAGWRDSEIGYDLRKVRNVKPLWTKLGLWLGVPFGGLDMWTNQLFNFSFFGTLKHEKADHTTLKPLSEVQPIIYPKPDGKITFDRASSVFLSNTNHEEDQPVHLLLADPTIPIRENLPLYGEPARLYCPAGVYEVVYQNEAQKTEPRFVINAQNCVHCKTCDIKDPSQNITWVPPEGGGGPNYPDM